jgi:hypothetical protein
MLLKSKRVNKNYTFSSKLDSENIIKPENNSKESIIPFSSVSQIKKRSSVLLKI